MGKVELRLYGYSAIYLYMKFTLAQVKAYNALLYFAERIKPLYLNKAIELLYLADEMAIKQTGVPIIWFNYNQLQKGNTILYLAVSPELIGEGTVLKSAEVFDDSQFSDYEIEVLDEIIKAYGKLNNLNKQFDLKGNRPDFIIKLTELLDTEFKRSAFEAAYQSYLMQKEFL